MQTQWAQLTGSEWFAHKRANHYFLSPNNFEQVATSMKLGIPVFIPDINLHPSDEIAANRISPGRCLGA